MGLACQVWFGEAGQGEVRQGLGVSKGMPRNGQAGCGEERRGIARFLGVAKAWSGRAWSGKAEQGQARHRRVS